MGLVCSRPTTTVTSTSVICKASTVLAPGSFIPIQESLPGSTYDENEGKVIADNAQGSKDVAIARLLFEKSALVHGTHSRAGDCCTRSAQRCTTKFVTSTSTEHVSSAGIDTVCIDQDRYTGSSSRSRTDPYAQQITATSTVTSTSITSTAYTACATNNFADAYNSTAIYDIIGGFNHVVSKPLPHPYPDPQITVSN